jgi:uncharacterized protein (DUF1501 family)
MISRRKFLSNSGLLTAAALAVRPRFLMAQSASAASGKNVVVLNLLGGMDGLAAFPYYSGALSSIINQELRPTLRIDPSKIIPLVSQAGEAEKIGLHPNFAPLANVARSNIKLIQGYGIPGDPGRSHDTCQTLMSLGSSSLRSGDNVGFLARIMDSQNWDSFQYWALLSENPSDTNTVKKPPVVISDVESLQFPRLWWESTGDESLSQELFDLLLQVQIPRDGLAGQQKDALLTLSQTLVTVKRDVITQKVGNNSAGNYSSEGVGASLRDVARIIKAKKQGLSQEYATRNTLLLLGQSGYDTHSDQNSIEGTEGLPGLITSLASNLAVFYRDLELMDALKDTVIVVYSEFGRTTFQNGTVGAASVGTDHGHASSTIVLGGPVRAGILGAPPSAAELRDKDYNALLPKVDYRDIFSDVLVWMGIRPEDIFDEPGYQRKPLGILS